MRFPSLSLIAVLSLAIGVVALEPVLDACGTCWPVQQHSISPDTYYFDSTVSSNETLKDWFRVAADEWNGALEASGATERITLNSNGRIRVGLDDTVCPDWGRGANQAGYVLLCSDTLLESAPFVRRIMSHEFGHVFGYASGNCSKNDSVMTDIQPSDMDPNTAISAGCADNAAIARDYDPPPDMCATDPAWPGCNSPLVIDTKGNGFKFTSASDGVMFDIDADGVPDRVGWTKNDSDDAWLAIDRNGNGVIENGSELFGDVTPTCLGEANVTVPN